MNNKVSEGIMFTDQYQFTMAQLYYKMGLHDTLVQFEHFFRNYPDYGSHKAGYCINAGLESLLNWMDDSIFGDKEINYLKSQTGNMGTRVFADDFLDWLKNHGNFNSIGIYSIPEGRVVHPGVPLNIVQGPLGMSQILESALLNKLNYQILIATKAARIKEAARGQPILEFGLRRGHDTGVNAGVRAALIGGADFTSNAGISHVLGYPPKGTHAHSMVQFFIAMGEGEIGAFRSYADLYPDDCLLLVDTINTLESGVPNAIKVFGELKRKGHKPMGIRLDSGDLAYLSIQSALMLDKAGFADTKIVLSNQLDELVIWQILTQIEQEAPKYGMDADLLIKRLIYGVGTRLITSSGSSALDGVYKLTSVFENGSWVPAIKLSESIEKTLNPGNKSVWRLYDKRAKATADLITLEEENPLESNSIVMHHPWDHTKTRVMKREDLSLAEPLLVNVLSGGELVYDLPAIDTIRKQRQRDMKVLDSGVKRIMNPHIYHVSLSDKLWTIREGLMDSYG